MMRLVEISDWKIKIQSLRFAKLGCRIYRHSPMLDRRSLDASNVNASAVIRNDDFYLAAAHLGYRQSHGRAGRFPRPRPVFRHFNSMIHAVSEQMKQRVFHFFQNALVDFNPAPLENKLHFFSLGACQVADHFGKDRQ